MLDYVALGILFFVIVILFYGIIVIHDIPYEIAKKRNHPQQDAIHVAGWVSLLTLHAIWPFLWIWATLYRSDRGWGFSKSEADDNHLRIEIERLNQRLEKLELRQTSESTEVNSTQSPECAIEKKSKPEPHQKTEG